MNTTLDTQRLFEVVRSICRKIKEVGGAAYVVGGATRDMWLASFNCTTLSVKDIDIEVFGLSMEVLKNTLVTTWGVDEVGKSFGVLKLRNLPIDVSIPRRENSVGVGHKDFHVECDPTMSLWDASLRRDFTINAISWDPLTNTWVDPQEGRLDLASKILRPVSSQFAEDPLRVLRGMQFIARFGLTPTAECMKICSGLSQEHLPKERIWEEWKKFILRGIHMKAGLEFLWGIRWVERFYPELEALIDSKQHAEWHPEGDVWNHTCLVLNAFAQGEFKNDDEKLLLGLTAICHDLGKPATAVFGPTKNMPEPHWTNRGHEDYILPTQTFLARLTNESKLVDQVIAMVRAHMKPMSFYRNNAELSAFRKLAMKVNLSTLEKFSRFDQGGRGPTKPPDEEGLKWFRDQATAAEVLYSKPQPIVLGRHLIPLGVKPGKEMGVILSQLMEKQLAGEFSTLEQGLEIAKGLIIQT